tara:strand:+ start:191 stop:355 length:165 start_codon:yes stop_codon:yes gene_type:complete
MNLGKKNKLVIIKYGNPVVKNPTFIIKKAMTAMVFKDDRRRRFIFYKTKINLMP